MERKPRDQKTSFFTGREWIHVGITGAVEAILTICAYLFGGGIAALAAVAAAEVGGDPLALSAAEATHQTAMTMAFLTLSLSQLFAAVGFQSERSSVFRIHPRRHPMLWLAFAGSAALQLMVVLFPPLRNLFNLQMLAPLQWIQVVALCLIMLLFVEAQKLIMRTRKKPQ